MLTRSKAKALAAEKTTVIVSPSATRQGIHTRWIYPTESLSSPSPPARDLHSEATSPPETPPQLGSWSSGSSLSTISDSSVSSLSDNSFHAAPAPGHIPSTPPPSTPKKLQRSPPNQRWVRDGTSWRLTLVHDSFSPEDALMQEGIIRRQTEEIYKTQYAALMVAHERATRAFGRDIDLHSDASDVDMEEEERREYIRGDTEPAEERDIRPSQRPQRLGPHGTELIDHDSFMSELPVYPDTWVAARKVPRWQPTEEFIS